MLNYINKYWCLIVFVVLIALTSCLVIGELTYRHSWGDDFSAYIKQAMHIVDGDIQAYVDFNRFSVENSSRGIGPVAYPWGYPVLLAPIVASYGVKMLALKSIGVASHILFITLFWFLFRKGLPPLLFLFLVAFFALNPVFIDFSDYIASDIPFLFFSMLSIILIQRNIQNIANKPTRSMWWEYSVMGVLIAFASTIRSNGILLLFTLLLSQCFWLSSNLFAITQVDASGAEAVRKKRVLLEDLRRIVPVNIVPYLSFVIFFILWKAIFPSGGEGHTSAIVAKFSFSQFTSQMTSYFLWFSEIFRPFPAPYKHLFFGATIPLALWGIIANFRSHTAFVFIILLNLLLLFIAPFSIDIRYLFPVLPFYLYFTFVGIDQSIKSIPDKFARTAYLCLYCLVFIYLLNSFYSVNRHNLNNLVNKTKDVVDGPFSSTYDEMFDFINANTEFNSIIVFWKPRVMALRTQRQSLVLHRIQFIENSEILKTNPAYLSIVKSVASYRESRSHQLPPNEVQQLLNQGRITRIFDNNGASIYKIDSDFNAQIIEALKPVQSDTAGTSPKRPDGSIAKSATEYINLSLQYYHDGEWEKSIEASIGALNISPGSALAYNNICAAYVQLEDFDGAILACNKALVLKPDFPLARGNLNAAIKQKGSN